MDTIINKFTDMRIDQPERRQPIIRPTQLIYALYTENQNLRQQIAELKALLNSQQPTIPHWVK
jgi:hypothetical protein